MQIQLAALPPSRTSLAKPLHLGQAHPVGLFTGAQFCVYVCVCVCVCVCVSLRSTSLTALQKDSGASGGGDGGTNGGGAPDAASNPSHGEASGALFAGLRVASILLREGVALYEPREDADVVRGALLVLCACVSVRG